MHLHRQGRGGRPAASPCTDIVAWRTMLRAVRDTAGTGNCLFVPLAVLISTQHITRAGARLRKRTQKGRKVCAVAFAAAAREAARTLDYGLAQCKQVTW